MGGEPFLPKMMQIPDEDELKRKRAEKRAEFKKRSMERVAKRGWSQFDGCFGAPVYMGQEDTYEKRTEKKTTFARRSFASYAPRTGLGNNAMFQDFVPFTATKKQKNKVVKDPDRFKGPKQEMAFKAGGPAFMLDGFPEHIPCLDAPEVKVAKTEFERPGIKVVPIKDGHEGYMDKNIFHRVPEPTDSLGCGGKIRERARQRFIKAEEFRHKHGRFVGGVKPPSKNMGCFSSAKDTFGLEESYKKEYEALPPDDDRPFEFRARPKSAPPGQDRGQWKAAGPVDSKGWMEAYNWVPSEYVAGTNLFAMCSRATAKPDPTKMPFRRNAGPRRMGMPTPSVLHLNLNRALGPFRQ